MTDLMEDRKDKQMFEENGFIGPIKLWEPDQMKAWWKETRLALHDPEASRRSVFNNPANYDRHLDISALSSLITEPEIVRRFQSLLGQDVLCWRTEFFPKNPGDAGTGWHQVETYSIGEAAEGMLEATTHADGVPMELTAWIAFTEATRENGCLKFLPGSHRDWHYDEKAKLDFDETRSSHTFFGYDYSQIKIDKDWEPDEQAVTHVEMQPGEFVIFTARCVHGSNPNASHRQRMGFSIRVVPTQVKVYSEMEEFQEFGHHFDLSQHGCVLVSGKDDYGHNRILQENMWGQSFVNRPR